jgi:hypothetical protein
MRLRRYTTTGKLTNNYNLIVIMLVSSSKPLGIIADRKVA